MTDVTKLHGRIVKPLVYLKYCRASKLSAYDTGSLGGEAVERVF